MRVKELMKILENCDPEDLVVISNDEEGNAFSTLFEVDANNLYISPHNGYNRDNFIVPESKQLQLDEGYEEVFTADNDVVFRCIVLWP